MGAVPETPASDMVLDDPTRAAARSPSARPASNATDVDPATIVRAAFSRPMDPATITDDARFTLKRPDGTSRRRRR